MCSAHEHLYSRNSKFTVVSVACVARSYWNVTLVENGAASLAEIAARNALRPKRALAVTRCVN